MILITNCNSLSEVRQKLIDGEEVTAKPIKEENTMKETSSNLTDKKLSYLMDYAKSRSDEIADLTYAASIRIAVLSAKIKELENDKG